jgi:penicillin amidase
MIVVVGLLVGVTLLFYVHMPLRGEIVLSSIKGDVLIRFDEKGIPYITGSSRDAVLFGLGYVHAMDRLFDMHGKRFLAYGRFSELLGEIALPIDKYLQTLLFDKATDIDLAQLDSEDIELLEAYADGVNAYVEQTIMLPQEFQLLGIEFEKWKVKDSLMILKLFSFIFSCGWNPTTLRQGIAEMYGEELANRLITLTEEDSFIEQTVIIQDEDLDRMGLLKKLKATSSNNAVHKKTEKVDKKVPSIEVRQQITITSKNEPQVNKQKFKVEADKTSDNSTRAKNPGIKIPHAPSGSNAWVVSGNYTESGYPIISSDPHLVHRIPSTNYMAAINIPNGPNLFGASFSGIPWFGIGRNDHVAWGLTLSYLETVDLYSIKHNKTHYFYNETWVPLTVHRHKIRVKGGEPVYYESYHTHHGPILYQGTAQEREILLSIVFPAFMDRPIAFSWIGIKEPDIAMNAYRMINYAKNINDLFEAAKKFDSIPVSCLLCIRNSNFTVTKNREIMILDIGQQVKFLFARI